MAKIFEDIDFTCFHEKFFEVLDYHNVSPQKFIEYIYYGADDPDVFASDLYEVLSLIAEGAMVAAVGCSFNWDSTEEGYSGWDSIHADLNDLELELAAEAQDDEIIF